MNEFLTLFAEIVRFFTWIYYRYDDNEDSVVSWTTSKKQQAHPASVGRCWGKRNCRSCPVTHSQPPSPVTKMYHPVASNGRLMPVKKPDENDVNEIQILMILLHYVSYIFNSVRSYLLDGLLLWAFHFFHLICFFLKILDQAGTCTDRFNASFKYSSMLFYHCIRSEPQTCFMLHISKLYLLRKFSQLRSWCWNCFLSPLSKTSLYIVTVTLHQHKNKLNGTTSCWVLSDDS